MSDSNNMEITIQPAGHLLMDDELHIRITGLQCDQGITVFTVISDEGKTLESCCCFIADHTGTVDLYKHAAISGSYTGVSPMGIFWSMAFSPEVRKGTRYVKKDMNTPVTANISVYFEHLTIDNIRKDPKKPEISRSVERWYKGLGVSCFDVMDGRLRGKLYLPEGPGPFPAVLDIFGTTGGIIEHRAALLAARGIAAFALPYFMYKDLPEKLEDLDLDYFIEAVHWLNQHEKVIAPVGVLAMSKGADIGYILAANCPQVRVFVAINGMAFNAGYPIKYSKGDIPAVDVQYDNIETVDDALSCKGMFTFQDSDLIPVWRHDPTVLNIISGDDGFIPSDSVHAVKRVYPSDRVGNYEIVTYPGAGHLLETPYTSMSSICYHKVFGSYMQYGGKPREHAIAQENSWKIILDFLRTNLPKAASSEESKL